MSNKSIFPYSPVRGTTIKKQIRKAKKDRRGGHQYGDSNPARKLPLAHVWAGPRKQA